MKRSKMLFLLIAAIVAVAVVVVLVLKPGVEPAPTEPTGPSVVNPTDGPTGPTSPSSAPTDPTGPSVPPTEPTGPATEPTQPSNPGPGIDLTPDVVGYFPKEYDYITGETPTANMPASVGEYDSAGYAFLQVWDPQDDKNERAYTFHFGQRPNGEALSGVKDYLCLNPYVLYTGALADDRDRQNLNDGIFQFHFMPSVGNIATFADAHYGKASRGKNGECVEYTFQRAFDFCLPAGYESDEFCGTVWYLDEDFDTSELVKIDVMVYYNEHPYAALRLYVTYNANGWRISSIANVDQSVRFTSPYVTAAGDDKWLTDDEIEQLVSATQTQMAQYYDEDKYHIWDLTEKDFIIDRCQVGEGTYFKYAGDSSSDLSLIDTSAFADYEMYAVSYRDATDYSPVTYYFYVLWGGDDDGNNFFELVAVDWEQCYGLGGLLVWDYPGYYYEP